MSIPESISRTINVARKDSSAPRIIQELWREGKPEIGAAQGQERRLNAACAI
jgi:hypothetical protein